MVASLGNTDLLKLRKIAFLCSRVLPASAVLKCYDWAIEQREQGNCVIGGFHSKIEKDVFHYLLAGAQPVIMVLARGMQEKPGPDLKAAIEAGRLLMLAPFENSVKRVTLETAAQRNRFMIELADDIVIGYANPGGMLAKLLAEVKEKKVTRIQE